MSFVNGTSFFLSHNYFISTFQGIKGSVNLLFYIRFSVICLRDIIFLLVFSISMWLGICTSRLRLFHFWIPIKSHIARFNHTECLHYWFHFVHHYIRIYMYLFLLNLNKKYLLHTTFSATKRNYLFCWRHCQVHYQHIVCQRIFYI